MTKNRGGRSLLGKKEQIHSKCYRRTKMFPREIKCYPGTQEVQFRSPVVSSVKTEAVFSLVSPLDVSSSSVTSLAKADSELFLTLADKLKLRSCFVPLVRLASMDRHFDLSFVKVPEVESNAFQLSLPETSSISFQNSKSDLIGFRLKTCFVSLVRLESVDTKFDLPLTKVPEIEPPTLISSHSADNEFSNISSASDSRFLGDTPVEVVKQRIGRSRKDSIVYKPHTHSARSTKFSLVNENVTTDNFNTPVKVAKQQIEPPRQDYIIYKPHAYSTKRLKSYSTSTVGFKLKPCFVPLVRLKASLDLTSIKVPEIELSDKKISSYNAVSEFSVISPSSDSRFSVDTSVIGRPRKDSILYEPHSIHSTRYSKFSLVNENVKCSVSTPVKINSGSPTVHREKKEFEHSFSLDSESDSLSSIISPVKTVVGFPKILLKSKSARIQVPVKVQSRHPVVSPIRD